MRQVEARAFANRITQDTLMERAGMAVARAVRRVAQGDAIVVLAGPGNNGGNAYVAARLLREWGHDVTLGALGTPKPGAAARAAERWPGPVVPFEQVGVPPGRQPQHCIVVDGLFGIGPQRPLHLGRAGGLFDLARRRIAIDVPTGIDADSGTAIGPPGSDIDHNERNLTVALGALKPAHVLNRNACGPVILDDLGLDDHITDLGQEPNSNRWQMIDRPWSTRPGRMENKYRAHVVIVSGAMPGAARLAARGAVGAGAGYVTLLGDPVGHGPFDAVVHRPLDSLPGILAEGKVRLVVGPGLGRDETARHILDAAIASDCWLVLDGDALTLLGETAADRLRRRGRTILTPHEAEFVRMFGEGTGNKIVRTTAAAERCGATVVHKGSTTVTSIGRKIASVSVNGSPWLATAGTGDVLAGAIAARGVAEWGVWLHARASQLAGPAFSADALADRLPDALAECS